MLSSTKSKLLISSILVTVAAIVSFTIFNTLLESPVRAQTDDLTENGVAKASSLEEASRIAGYPVTTLNVASAGLEQSELDQRIWVVQLRTSSRGPESRPVQQDWILQDGSWFILVQILRSAESIQSIEGEPVDIGGMAGKRVFFEVASDVPPRVVFYWHDGDRRYSLGGTLTESLSEEMLLKLAESVGVR